MAVVGFWNANLVINCILKTSLVIRGVEKMNNFNFHEFEDIVNYWFEDEDLLIEALTHSSYANERKNKKWKYNERLEFLGDSVLGLIISDYLFTNHVDLPEGELTKTRARIVCEVTLSDCAILIDLGRFIMLGKGEELTGGRTRPSLLADAFEAVIGAIYLDGGIESARAFILKFMTKKIDDALTGKIFIDYKTRLQELIQNDGQVKIIYEVVRDEGPDHNKTFYTHVKRDNTVIGEGMGKSKKESEQNAAKMALKGVFNIE